MPGNWQNNPGSRNVEQPFIFHQFRLPQPFYGRETKGLPRM